MAIDSYSDVLDKTSFGGTFVGNLSSLDVDTDGSILALSDRSALFSLDPLALRPTGVVALADENGRPLDSEGLAVDRDGTRLISSEVEPSVRRYARDGRLLGRLPVPDSLLVAPAGRASTNLTFEGLTLQPDGRTLVASMEAALSGDQGNLVRFQTWTRPTVPGAAAPGAAAPAGSGDFALGIQYGYAVDPGLGVSELRATGDGRLLVLERGYVPGLGNTIRLYLADLTGASDVSGVQDLTQRPPVQLIRKTLLADLVHCPTLGATARERQVNPLLDNIEGLTIIGSDPDGALRLLLVSDDNQSTDQTTRLYTLTTHLPKA
ncbi:MAG TPA: esterase-like activity of phytase family protein [Pseudonocardia sp.]|nr:esterase-like activity of phytase family protein [Pseudonocardia sp.]